MAALTVRHLDRMSRTTDLILCNVLIAACILGTAAIVVLFSRNHARQAAEDCAESLAHVCSAKWSWAEENHAATFPEKVIGYAAGRPIAIREGPILSLQTSSPHGLTCALITIPGRQVGHRTHQLHTALAEANGGLDGLASFRHAQSSHTSLLSNEG